MFLGGWNGLEDMKEDFWPSWDDYRKQDAEEALAGFEVLFAHYGGGSYDGEAFVLLESEGKFFEVNAGHCSCYGLEGQWEPEEACLEELVHRVEKGRLGRVGYFEEEYFADDLLKILKGLRGGYKVEVAD